MSCHSCWEQAYKLRKKQYKISRFERGEQVRKKAIEPMQCPLCHQAMNTRNEAEEVYNAKAIV